MKIRVEFACYQKNLNEILSRFHKKPVVSKTQKKNLVSIKNHYFQLPQNTRNLVLSHTVFIVNIVIIKEGQQNWLTKFSEVSLPTSASLPCACQHIVLLCATWSISNHSSVQHIVVSKLSATLNHHFQQVLFEKIPSPPYYTQYCCKHDRF